VTSIFEGPLRCWRASSGIDSLRLGVVYEDRVRGAPQGATGPRKNDDALRAAHQLARTIDAAAVDPFDVLGRVREYPLRDVKTCQTHGDLHPRNAFVRDNSSEMILIDFAKAGSVGTPMLLDAATLDVALAFDGWDDPATEMPEAEIDALYRTPVFGIDTKGYSTRAIAVGHVRRHAKGDCEDDSEYVVALVAGLLRTARLLANVTVKGKAEAKRVGLIALAIRCAHRLAVALP